jgi:hypothetical protein
MIPKLCFTYWEGSQLSILHYYTIYSLVKYNQDMKIIIYSSLKKSEKLRDWTSIEHRSEINANIIPFDSITNISKNIELIDINFEEEYNINSNISIIYKADFIRIAKLYEHGGIWFDFDILFIKPIPSYYFESNIDIYYFTYLSTIPTGFLMVSSKHKILELILTDAKKRINSLDSYQSLGPNIWKEFFDIYPHLLLNSICLSNSIIYPYTSEHIRELFLHNIDYTSTETIGIHWYNGSTLGKRYINNLNLNDLNKSTCIISKYLDKIIN